MMASFRRTNILNSLFTAESETQLVTFMRANSLATASRSSSVEAWRAKRQACSSSSTVLLLAASSMTWMSGYSSAGFSPSSLPHSAAMGSTSSGTLVAGSSVSSSASSSLLSPLPSCSLSLWALTFALLLFCLSAASFFFLSSANLVPENSLGSLFFFRGVFSHCSRVSSPSISLAAIFF